MTESNQSPELSKGVMSADEIDDEEYRQLVAIDRDFMLGKVVIRSLEGEAVSSQFITYNHQKVGAMLNPDVDRGFSQLEEALYKDLSEEQLVILKQIQNGIRDQGIDLF